MTSLVGPVPRPSPNKNPIRSSVVLPSRRASQYAGLDARQAEVVERIAIYNDELANLYRLALRSWVAEQPDLERFSDLLAALDSMIPTLEEEPAFTLDQVVALVRGLDEATILDPSATLGILREGLAGKTKPKPPSKDESSDDPEDSQPHRQSLGDLRLGPVRLEMPKRKGELVYAGEHGPFREVGAPLEIDDDSISTGARLKFEHRDTEFGFGVTAGFGKDLRLPFRHPTSKFDTASVGGEFDVSHRLSKYSKLVVEAAGSTEGYSFKLAVSVKPSKSESSERKTTHPLPAVGAEALAVATATAADRAFVDAVPQKAGEALDPEKPPKERLSSAVSLGSLGGSAFSAHSKIAKADKLPVVSFVFEVSGNLNPKPPTLDPATGAPPIKALTWEQFTGHDDPRGKLITLDSMTGLLGKGQTPCLVMFKLDLRF